jgi:PPP family 3-phenylpropionic acid transporter
MAFLLQAGFGAYYVFFTLHLQRAGHDGLAVGLLWAVGVLVEIGLFFLAPTLLKRFPIARIMAVCLAVTAVRWALTALFPGSFAILLALQSTHALGYALLHACTMARMAELFPAGDAARGQSLLYGFSSGGGGVAGALIAAVLWEWQGGLAAFLGGAVATVLAWVIIARASRAAR